MQAAQSRLRYLIRKTMKRIVIENNTQFSAQDIFEFLSGYTGKLGRRIDSEVEDRGAERHIKVFYIGEKIKY